MERMTGLDASFLYFETRTEVMQRVWDLAQAVPEALAELTTAVEGALPVAAVQAPA